jgi:hypothetical protein
LQLHRCCFFSFERGHSMHLDFDLSLIQQIEFH